MKPIFDNKEALAHYFNFEVKSHEDDRRLGKAWYMYTTNYKGDGCLGCCAEVLTATTKSKKTTVSNTGRVDCYVKYKTASGHTVPVSVERKTNGGRIRTIETEFSAAEEMSGKYVVYSLDVCNAGTNYLRRYVPAVVIPRKLFVEKLIEFNAIKTVRHNGVVDGYAIQCTSKRLFLWLADWPIVYDRNAVYCDDDFEGLE